MITRRIARPLLASVFIAGGIDQLRRPADKAKVAGPVLDAVQSTAAPTVGRAAETVADAADQAADAVSTVVERAPVATDDPVVEAATGAAEHARTAVHELADGRRDLFADETLVRINGAVQVGAGLLLASNRMPRIAATALAATLVPTTLGGHRWWEEEGPERELQQFNFLKNVALLGGLILAAADTEGAPGVAWRLRRANREGKLAARAAAANAAVAAHAAALDAKAAKQLAKANAKAAGKGGELAVVAASRGAAKAAKVAQRHATVTSGRAGDLASDLAPKVQAAGHTFVDRAAEVAADLAPKVQAAAQRATAALPTPTA